MLDKFRFKRWEIAYRRRGEENFQVISNPAYGWCADPFLVEYKGTLYLFAEIFLYKSERNGVIGYCIYEDGEFGSWIITMDRHWHLSYPNVFVHGDNLYMCPESYQKEEVEIYKLIEFPDHWEKVASLLENGRYVDTTFLQVEGQTYIFSFEPTFQKSGGRLLQYKIENGVPSNCRVLTDDKSKARPGGKFFEEAGKIIRVSQDSAKEYGGGLVFSEVKSIWPEYVEYEVKRILPENVHIKNGKKYIGIHTYNRCGNLEVIDLKYSCYSLKEYIARKRVRRVFVNKYRK